MRGTDANTKRCRLMHGEGGLLLRSATSHRVPGDGFPWGLRLNRVLGRIAPDPFQYGAGTDAKHLP
jgi:hypothetical protein